jgi:hypothetical protein
MSIQKCIIAAVLFAASASAEAQTAGTAAVSGAARVAQLVATTCPAFSSRLVDRPELKPLLGPHPIDITAVCACAQKSFVGDRRLQAALNVDEQTLANRMNDDPMRTYLTVRLMASVLACLSPELEKSLAATSPVK